MKEQFKMISKASTFGYKKIETDEFNLRGFPEVNLLPVYYDGKIYVPTGYVCYKKELLERLEK